MPVANRDFASLYFEALGLAPASSASMLDENLSMDYPFCLYRFEGGPRLCCLCPELEDALPALENLPPDADFSSAWAYLFEEGLRFSPETVTGFYLPTPPFSSPDARIRPLRRGDGPALSALHKGCGREWMAAAIHIRDFLSLGLFDDRGALLAAASAQPFGPFGDISVFTHPAHRGKGLGAQVVLSLCSKLFEKGLLPLYRAEDANKPSIALARHLGFQPGFTMTGALVYWPCD